MDTDSSPSPKMQKGSIQGVTLSKNLWVFPILELRPHEKRGIFSFALHCTLLPEPGTVADMEKLLSILMGEGKVNEVTKTGEKGGVRLWGF